MAKVLIISSDKGSRYLYEVAITYQKVEVLVADTVAEGIKVVTSAKPDMVVLDIMVPDIKELGLLAELKTKANQMPLIIITDMQQTDLPQEAGILGACQFMVKGESSLGDLIKKVRTLGKLGE